MAQSPLAVADPPDTRDTPAGAGSSSASSANAPASTASPSKGKAVDKAAAYYHFCLAHMYEEQVATYGRSDLANKAIEEYR
ncbi:MAG: hypothetical protein WAK13_07280, partial [Terriglobales bacterium]